MLSHLGAAAIAVGLSPRALASGHPPEMKGESAAMGEDLLHTAGRVWGVREPKWRHLSWPSRLGPQRVTAEHMG